MKLDSVMQLQAMNEMMKVEFDTYSISNVIIFGIAGGNGLEHIQKDNFEKCVTIILTIIGFCSDARIAFEKKWKKFV